MEKSSPLCHGQRTRDEAAKKLHKSFHEKTTVTASELFADILPQSHRRRSIPTRTHARFRKLSECLKQRQMRLLQSPLCTFLPLRIAGTLIRTSSTINFPVGSDPGMLCPSMTCMKPRRHPPNSYRRRGCITQYSWIDMGAAVAMSAAPSVGLGACSSIQSCCCQSGELASVMFTNTVESICIPKIGPMLRITEGS